MNMARILIIDDDRMMCDMISNKIKRMNHEVDIAYNLESGLAKSKQTDFDVVFLDVRLPDGNGLEIIPKLRNLPSVPEIIIITGLGDPDGAELAIKNGAWDYIEKGSSLMAMTLPLARALQYREEKTSSHGAVSLIRDEIIGNSPKMKQCLDLLAQASTTDANVLISGETGTGKEIFAWALHKNSRRAENNFVVVDCTALPDKLIESMLFGHKKGAFTGASESQKGLIKQADEGTLFLDEIGELPLELQKSFLRVLQTHRFRPVGSDSEASSNFRLIAATNRNLDKMVEEGTFREDLLFRLRSFSIILPPLRERMEDVKALTLFHTSRICDKFNIGTKGFSPEFFDSLMSYDWPGNVRELVNTLERAITATVDEPVIFPNHLPIEIRVKIARTSISREANKVYDDTDEFSTEGVPTYKDIREKTIHSMEKKYMDRLMLFTNGNIKEACKVSDLSRSRLYVLLKKYGITAKETSD